MNTGDLGGDVYINYTISTTVETIAVFFCIFADKFPRKMLFCPAMIIGSCACLSTIFTSIYGGKCEYTFCKTKPKLNHTKKS